MLVNSELDKELDSACLHMLEIPPPFPSLPGRDPEVERDDKLLLLVVAIDIYTVPFC